MKKIKLSNEISISHNSEESSQINDEDMEDDGNIEEEDDLDENEGDLVQPYIEQDKERDFYERALLDFYRFKHPDSHDFINCVTEMFQEENYIIKDYMASLSKDAKCCMIDYLNVFDICRLARTCSYYREIVESPKYNEYWRNRFLSRFPISYVEKNGVYMYRSKPKSMLWFDIYQYSVFYNCLGVDRKQSKRLTMNKQSLHSFVKAKRKGFPGVCKLNVYFKGDYKIRQCLSKEFEFTVDNDLVSLLGLQCNKVTEEIFIKSWRNFFMSNFLKIKTQKDLMEYRKTLPQNQYYGKKGCLFDVPQDFKIKWRLSNTSCSCPYDNSLTPMSLEAIPNMFIRCPELYLKGSTIMEPLENEVKKYKYSYY